MPLNCFCRQSDLPFPLTLMLICSVQPSWTFPTCTEHQPHPAHRLHQSQARRFSAPSSSSQFECSSMTLLFFSVSSLAPNLTLFWQRYGPSTASFCPQKSSSSWRPKEYRWFSAPSHPGNLLRCVKPSSLHIWQQHPPLPPLASSSPGRSPLLSEHCWYKKTLTWRGGDTWEVRSPHTGRASYTPEGSCSKAKRHTNIPFSPYWPCNCNNLGLS